ncbi:AzlD domain-containing protein [Caproiciproducens faecalis]|uniref:AzlD domain-containing protein n=1 Tax=Caproiciproducens faecalis TaxID=2820301 RepID=A0ABS7DK54_9FIRM|nr:AzlD domain-containing protein [Caproiciproducens faecalis]MBW7571598.1 AzlD domain-containing protein [Caproiciproducens faecalis]
MNVQRILICTLIMATVTYFIRMIPLAIFKQKIHNRFIRSFLAYVPYAVLAAMTFPEILYSTGNLYSAVIGLAAALILAYQDKGLLTVALGSTAAVFIAEQVMSFF